MTKKMNNIYKKFQHHYSGVNVIPTNVLLGSETTARLRLPDSADKVGSSTLILPRWLTPRQPPVLDIICWKLHSSQQMEMHIDNCIIQTLLTCCETILQIS